MFETLATGRWLTPQRIVVAAVMSLAMTVGIIAYLFATAHGTLDYLGRPLGTDFSNVWSAGRMAFDGRAAAAWNWSAQAAEQRAIHHDPDVPFYGWHYPPPFLLIAALLALLPYKLALAAWQLATLLPAIWLVTRIVPGRRTCLVAAGAPVVLVCLGHGHNGFLTAALFGGGLLLLDRRPWLAGLLLGCLIYKPQFGLAVPVLLLAGGHWRAATAAAFAALALVFLTLVLWGWPVWQAFLDSLPLTRAVVIEAGSTGWYKIQTAFGAVRAAGGSIPLAYAAQTVVTCAALLAVLVASRGAQASVRNAIVLIAALLSTPYALDYDYTIAGVAIAFLIAHGQRHGFLRWEQTALAFCWLSPLFARSIAEATSVPLGFLSALAILALAIRRMLADDPALRAWPSRRSRAASAP